MERETGRGRDRERDICSILAGILTLILPETRDTKLPDSIKVMLDRRKEILKQIDRKRQRQRNRLQERNKDRDREEQTEREISFLPPKKLMVIR